MPKNLDGLEAGQPVDFQTLMRVERQRGKRDAPTDEAPKRRRKAPTRQRDRGAAAAAEE